MAINTTLDVIKLPNKGYFSSGKKVSITLHHIRKLADIQGKGGRSVPAWRRHMMAIQRKTLVLCRQCHVKLHQGKFDENFESRH